MNILVAGSTFPSGALDGAAPRFVYDLAESLSEHATVVALAPHEPGSARRERMGNVQVERFRYWWPAAGQALTPNMRQRLQASWLARLQVPFFFVSQILAFRRLVRRRDIDVVNAHWLVPQGLSAVLAGHLTRKGFRLALHVHAGDVYLLARLPFGGLIARHVVRRAHCIFAAGSHVRDTLDDLIGYPSKARLQPMGVHSDVFGNEASAPSETTDFPDGFIVSVGRFVEKKGTIYLIRAMPLIREQYPGLGLVLVGSGPDEEALKAEVERLDLGGKVLFVGHQPHAAVAGYLQHCRAAAVPSVIDSRGETEGMPTVVIEAMAAGVPVVGSNVDGIPDVVRHGENGWLCHEKDPEDLARKLLTALDTAREAGVASEAVRTAEAFEWSRLGRRYYEALHP